jgi:hypothetical protein
MEGRMTGSPGEALAAAHIEAALKALGARPLPGRESLQIPFEFTAGSRDAGSTVTLAGGEAGPRTFQGEAAVLALSFSDAGRVEGPVVFAGYGLSVPDGQEPAYDSYAALDVEGKVVVVLRYSPENASEELRTALTRYSGLRYKALQARERGAAALVVVTGPLSPNAGRTVEMSFDAALADSGIVAASVGGDVAAALFEQRDLERIQRELDSGNPHVAGFEVPDRTLTLDVRIERERRTGRNVVGWLPPSAGPSSSRPWVVAGAHYDHLGRGGHGNSLARKHEASQIHRGADDNASGVAALLEAGRRLAAAERASPIALAFWSGEELGLLGSAEFLAAAAIPPEQIAAYVNLDMVGRLRNDRLSLQGAGSSSVWAGLIERTNVTVGLDVHPQQDPWLPTDATSFYRARVPTLSLFTGGHEDYHRPTDTADKINYEGLERVAGFVTSLVSRLAALDERPAYVRVERRPEAAGSRDTVRAYTGTIPDYATEVEGLRLSGVIAGGPADLAGLTEGDVIVELGGRKITNIYDYTYALDAVKIGEPIAVVFVRGGERRQCEITPTARP